MRINGRSMFSLFLMIVMIVLLTDSFHYNSKARMIPIGVGVILLIMSCVQFIMDAIPGAAKKLAFLQNNGMSLENGQQTVTEAENQQGKQISEQKKEWAQFSQTIAWLTGFLFLLQFFSFLLIVPLFLFLLIWLVGKHRWTTALGVAAGTVVFLYVLFDLVLQSSI